jgi:hypothetical protein
MVIIKIASIQGKKNGAENSAPSGFMRAAGAQRQ